MIVNCHVFFVPSLDRWGGLAVLSYAAWIGTTKEQAIQRAITKNTQQLNKQKGS